ncbi:Bifunctional inhibitor/plant lipid transfer protein/seed storage helical domain containing protein [Trema orientale]|uniref:Bifunctional inhibitor/plant lipid transfer protein/seed storage helical domain containing protein n=1 Tax=Trema orientale TaxID=63057 RepID=A0A2P5AJA6_TREOI|nr:Bifunctional inhibitor/plant lipid transfer protein/seed storage helical domain containing protein [Trema orientale]
MKKLSFLALCVVVVSAAMVILSEVPTAEAVNCSPFQLIWCLPAITRGTRPSDLCCTKLDEQEPCLCGYIKNPNLQQYVNSPHARDVSATCGVPYPKCS